jgi:hypothetical protein
MLRKIAKPFVDIIEPIEILTPNRLTWTGMAFVIFGGYLIAIAGDNNFILFLAGLSFWISLLFDVFDGEIARRRGISTKNGEWLDSTLEHGKGIPFLIGIALNIANSNGMFNITISNFIFTLNVWFVLFILYASISFITIGASRSTAIFDEQRIVSHGHVYFGWAILTLNILEIYLILHTIGAVFVVLYTLVDRTFFLQKAE